MAMDILIREANMEDAQLMADLTRAAWAEKVAHISRGHRETALQVEQHLYEGGGFILLLDEQAAGSVRWVPLEGASDIWEILRLGILSDFRGHNLSQYLLEAVIHHALGCDISELRLAVRTDQSRLVDLYAAYGFELAQELEYSHANPLDAPPIVMRRMLKH